MQTETLSISLPRDMAQMLRRTVDTGAYASSSEVIRDALRLWQRREEDRNHRLESVRASLHAAAADPARHNAADVSDHFDRLLAEAEKTARP